MAEIDYRQSGVDIDAGNEVVRRIKQLARGTYTPGVLSGVGSFGGLFAVHALATKPELFNVVIAVSPTLHWRQNEPVKRLKALVESRPDLNRTLYITLGELRSRAAESLEIARGAARSRLTGHFVRAQAGQLAARIASIRDALAKAATHDGAADARVALPLSERLLALTRALAEHAETPSAAMPIERDLSHIVERLVPLARSARPG